MGINGHIRTGVSKLGERSFELTFLRLSLELQDGSVQILQ